MEIKSNKLAGGAETWGLRRPDGVSEQDNDSYSPDTGLIIGHWTVLCPLIGQSLTYFYHREHDDYLLITVVI